jgi:hypothetical protein
MLSELPPGHNLGQPLRGGEGLDSAREIAFPSRLPCKDKAMADELPDRLSVNPKSPYYDAAILERDVGMRFNGQEKTNVEEYCVSEGWIRVAVGKTVDRKGDPLTIKLTGKVEPYFRGG